MLEAVKITAAIIATVIAVTAYIPYLLAMLKGKSKPHLYTWIGYFLVTIMVAIIQYMGGAGIGAIPITLSAIVNAVILFYCFKLGTRDIVLIDKVCLAVSVIGIVAFAALNSRPLISLAIVTVAEVISFVPTFRKTRNDPYSESLPSYYLSLAKLVLIVVSLHTYDLLTISYPIVWGVVFVAFLTSVYRWRLKKPKHQALPPDIAHI
jgi:hypothetical protein